MVSGPAAITENETTIILPSSRQAIRQSDGCIDVCPHRGSEVWSLHAKDVEGIWNDDWDSNGVVVDDILYIGGENSWWYAIKLNRGYNEEGMVTVDPLVRPNGRYGT